MPRRDAMRRLGALRRSRRRLQPEVEAGRRLRPTQLAKLWVGAASGIVVACSRIAAAATGEAASPPAELRATESWPKKAEARERWSRLDEPPRKRAAAGGAVGSDAEAEGDAVARAADGGVEGGGAAASGT